MLTPSRDELDLGATYCARRRHCWRSHFIDIFLLLLVEKKKLGHVRSLVLRAAVKKACEKKKDRDSALKQADVFK